MGGLPSSKPGLHVFETRRTGTHDLLSPYASRWVDVKRFPLRRPVTASTPGPTPWPFPGEAGRSTSASQVCGFRMSCGSKAALIRRCRSRLAAPSSCSIHGRLVMPTPCSPLIVPPSDMAVRTSSSAAIVQRPRRDPAVRRIFRQREQGMQVAVAGVRDNSGRQSMMPADLLDGGQHGSEGGPRNGDILADEPAVGGEPATVPAKPQVALAGLVIRETRRHHRR